jgi:hypothetical protein
VYKITCTKGKFKDKFYFGQHTTNNINDGYKGSGCLIKDYYKKYPNDYIKEIISFHNTQEELNKAEYDIILPYLNTQMCLNRKEGGGNNKLSEETKRKLSELHKGIKSPKKGIPLSEETKQKISDKLKSQGVWNKGKKGLYHHTEESKQKMSAAHKGIPNIMKGKHYSGDMKIKMSTLRSENNKNRRWVTNGIINHFVLIDDVDYYLSIGYNLGKTHKKGA